MGAGGLWICRRKMSLREKKKKCSFTKCLRGLDASWVLLHALFFHLGHTTTKYVWASPLYRQENWSSESSSVFWRAIHLRKCRSQDLRLGPPHLRIKVFFTWRTLIFGGLHKWDLLVLCIASRGLFNYQSAYSFNKHLLEFLLCVGPSKGLGIMQGLNHLVIGLIESTI